MSLHIAIVAAAVALSQSVAAPIASRSRFHVRGGCGGVGAEPTLLLEDAESFVAELRGFRDIFRAICTHRGDAWFVCAA